MLPMSSQIPTLQALAMQTSCTSSIKSNKERLGREELWIQKQLVQKKTVFEGYTAENTG